MEYIIIGILQIFFYSAIMIAIGRVFKLTTMSSLLYGWVILMTIAYIWFNVGDNQNNFCFQL